ncbi:hypothetical protein GWI33_023304, partial [Rhynchophorus ferrugineus]
PPVFSDEEEETPAKEAEQPEVVVSLETLKETPKATEETQVTVITEKKVEYKGLPIDETSTDFVNILDEPPVFSDAEEETPVKETEEPEVIISLETKEETPKTTEEAQVIIVPEKKVEYKGLPIDETSTAFVDILDEPPVLPDTEEEIPLKESEEPEVTLSLETREESPKATEEIQLTLVAEEKVEYKGLPIDETSTAFVTSTTEIKTIGEQVLSKDNEIPASDPIQEKYVSSSAAEDLVLSEEPKEISVIEKKVETQDSSIDESSSAIANVLNEPPTSTSEDVLKKEPKQTVQEELIIEMRPDRSHWSWEDGYKIIKSSPLDQICEALTSQNVHDFITNERSEHLPDEPTDTNPQSTVVVSEIKLQQIPPEPVSETHLWDWENGYNNETSALLEQPSQEPVKETEVPELSSENTEADRALTCVEIDEASNEFVTVMSVEEYLRKELDGFKPVLYNLSSLLKEETVWHEQNIQKSEIQDKQLPESPPVEVSNVPKKEEQVPVASTDIIVSREPTLQEYLNIEVDNYKWNLYNMTHLLRQEHVWFEQKTRQSQVSSVDIEDNLQEPSNVKQVESITSETLTMEELIKREINSYKSTSYNLEYLLEQESLCDDAVEADTFIKQETSVENEKPTVETQVVVKPDVVTDVEIKIIREDTVKDEVPIITEKIEYKGLPIDETSTVFVDVLDEPAVFSDEKEIPVKEPEAVVFQETKEETPQIAKETQVTPITEKKVEYKGLPIDETSTAFV